MAEDVEPVIHPSEWDQDISHWKTYCNEKYQVEFKYPPSFVVATRDSEKNEMGDGIIALISIVDAKFVPTEGMVGAEARLYCAGVDVYVEKFSEKNWDKEEGYIKRRWAGHLQYSDEFSSSLFKTNLGYVQTYVLYDGIMEIYFRASFSNEQYIYIMRTMHKNFSKLACDILSTWKGPKFTKGNEQVVPSQVK